MYVKDVKDHKSYDVKKIKVIVNMENTQLHFKLRDCKVDPWQGPHVTDQQRWHGGKVRKQGPCYAVAGRTCVPVPCIWNLTTQFQG